MRIALIILPVAASLLTMLALRRAGLTRSAAAMVGVVFIGVWVATTTETLSATGLLSPWGLIGVWVTACIAAGAVWLAMRSRVGKVVTTQRTAFSGPEWLICAMLFVVLLLTLATAISSVPNNWDSMTYHLPRVMHWWQNGSVAHYPTAVSRQLYQPPLAEFGLLHIYGLAGTDCILNLLQWVALIINLVAVASIASHLGGSRLTQLLAAVMVATIPPVILQASNTKNTLVLAMWLTVAVAQLLESQRKGACRKPLLAVSAGIAMGLAVLTHGLALLLVLPLGILWLIVVARLLGKHSIAPILGATLISFAINVPHWARNTHAFGNPLGDSTADYHNASFGPGTIASNAIRSLSLHLATPWEDTNAGTADGVSESLAVVGIDANDPGNTWGGRFQISPRVLNEDYAPAPLHVLLLISGLVIAIVWRGEPRMRALAVVVIVQGLLFCLVLKWQVWHTRLHMPMVMLGLPLMAIALAAPWRGRLAAPVAAALFLASFPWLIWNESRPLFGPDNVRAIAVSRQYFHSWPVLGDELYLPAIEQLHAQPWNHLGLVINDDGYEYPLWPLLILPRAAKLSHETPQPYSAETASTAVAAEDAPHALLYVAVDLPGDLAICRGQRYRLVWVRPGVAIYWRVDLMAEASPLAPGPQDHRAANSARLATRW